MPGRSLVIEEVSDAHSGACVLRLNGPLILTTIEEFQSRVRAVQSKNLVLDLTGVPYLDSAGIGALVGTYVRHQRDKNGVSLVGANDRVVAALKIAHIDHFFRFFDSESKAIGDAG